MKKFHAKKILGFCFVLLIQFILGFGSNPVRADVYNQVLTVSPESAVQGMTNLAVTFTLDTDAPMAPPPGDLPNSATIGNISGEAIDHPDQFTVTARFNIPVETPPSALDVAVTFSIPSDTLIFRKIGGFTVTETLPSPTATAAPCGEGAMNLQQAITDQAQRTTIAFSGFGLITGNLEAQSFFPPGKLADYWGFQYLRDNDPNNMGHNTSFLTRVACNMLYILDTSQIDMFKSLARNQVTQINEFGYRRYSLMKAFRRLLEGDVPPGSSGLNRNAVMDYSAQLYQLDGQISFDRAVAYADIFRSLTVDQTSYMDAMVGVGWDSWPDKTMDDVRDKLTGLSQDESVAVMTYAGDMFSWYAGCVDADIYFCPERHGTYYGGFYIKDAPAIGHEGYSIDEQLTAEVGAALCDSALGYVTPEQAALMSSLVDEQRNNLYDGSINMVQARTDIANALRSLISETAPSDEFLAQAEATVLEKSGSYGELDGENNYFYATVFAQVFSSLSANQLTNLLELRSSVLSGVYSDGTPFDFTVCTTYYLFSAVISDLSVLDPYINNTDFLFEVPSEVPSTSSLGLAVMLVILSVLLSSKFKGFW